MSILNATCDDCGRLIGGVIYTDHDGNQRCKECSLKNRLYYLGKEHEDLEQWLKETHLAKLSQLKIRIKSMRKELEMINKLDLNKEINPE